MVSLLKFFSIPNAKKIQKLSALSILIALAVYASPIQSNKACATALEPVCDPAFMTAMKTKAWMEAQREFMIAQSTIAKPDSVFAYGCFGFFANQFNPAFFFAEPYPIKDLVTAYVQAGFPHMYGGGHLESDMNNGMNDSCALMSTVWNLARCTQAVQDMPEEKIMTLLQSSTFDRGNYPQACPSPGTWEPRLDLFRIKNPNLSVGAAYNDMNIFLLQTAPLSEAGACAPGIPTGLLFPTTDGGTGSAEVVCPNPGCVADTAGACNPM